MAETLIIWTNDAAGTSLPARWLVLDANGNRAGFPQQGELPDAAPLAAGRRVIVMLPGERVVAASAHVPGGNHRRILQAAPYALEDRLAGDVEALHVALLARGIDAHCDFLVVERDWLAGQLAALGAAGIKPDRAWPDYLGVPVGADEAHWIIHADRILGREGWHGFAAPVDDAAFLYAHRDSESPLRLTMTGETPAPAALGELETARIADGERAFTELAATIATLPGNGLLQGEFRRRREDRTDWSRWRWPAIAAGVLLVLMLAATGIDAWRLQREHAFLETAKRELFEQALPGNQRMVDARFQIEQALGSAEVEGSHALDYIASLGHALQEIPGARLNGFNYRNAGLELSVTVRDATALESLRDALAQRAGQPVEVQSANSTADGLEGRLLLASEVSR